MKKVYKHKYRKEKDMCKINTKSLIENEKEIYRKIHLE